MRNKLVYIILVVVWIGYFVWEIANKLLNKSVKTDDIRMDVILIPSLLLLITAFLIYQLSKDKDQ
ncbi:MAG: hypothetical protein DHS20C18_13800 [Saprospiraceae bacterium]|nr:MAG: hypothetical protein DHS20C18_13800 [Saprospiraceae bacterium]